jgi:type I restriction enzyme S subunit
LARFEFALPPVDEQLRILSVLKKYQEMVEALRAAEIAAERTKRAALLDAFRPFRGSKDTFPMHWELIAAKELGDVQLGQQRHPKYESGSNIRPYLRVANVLDGYIDFSDLLEMDFPERDVGKFELKAGDILLNEGQSFDLVGRSAVYKGEIPGLCCQKTLIRFRCGSRLLPEFAQAYFQHRLYTGQFAAMCVQTTSMAHLTAVRFAAMKIPVPPLDEQEKIAEAVRTATEARNNIRERIQAAMSLDLNKEVLA